MSDGTEAAMDRDMSVYRFAGTAWPQSKWRCQIFVFGFQILSSGCDSLDREGVVQRMEQVAVNSI